MQKVKAKEQLVQTKEWMDKRVVRRTRPIALSLPLARSVTRKLANRYNTLAILLGRVVCMQVAVLRSVCDYFSGFTVTHVGEQN